MQTTEQDSPSPFVVSDQTQARFLTDPAKKRFFLPFLGRERRIAEVGCSTNRMLYQVRTLLGCGLLQVLREEPRAGRAVRVYRSIHDAYFVPFAATPYDTLEHRITVQGDPIWAGLIAAYADALRRSRRHGHLLRRVGDVVQITDQLPDSTPSGQALFWSDSTITIRDADARRLGRGGPAVVRGGPTTEPRGTRRPHRPPLPLPCRAVTQQAHPLLNPSATRGRPLDGFHAPSPVPTASAEEAYAALVPPGVRMPSLGCAPPPAP